jgi:hypothetical protein
MKNLSLNYGGRLLLLFLAFAATGTIAIIYLTPKGELEHEDQWIWMRERKPTFL